MLPSYLRANGQDPVFFAGVLGIAMAVWRFPLRAVIPLLLFAAGTFTFVATGLAGLSVIVRYLLVPSVMLSLFAAFTVGGWTMLPRGSRRAGMGRTGAGRQVARHRLYVAPTHPTRPASTTS